nr:6547_t:CDS:2 [Entrophospora candida]
MEKNRDHRTIAKGLELYILDEKQQEFNFQEVMTPILGSENLYQTSGHLAHYQDSMFPAISRNNETLYLRPMTCPHHCLIYQQKPRSYRDLPFRLCENSILHRYEASGGLKGLERPRCFELADHHIFVSQEHLKEEVKKNYHYITDFLAKNLLVNSLNELELKYETLKGEAAFYGPKLDIEVEAADGKNITISTIQLDFVLPQKFGLNYIDKEQKLQTPVIIHQSPFVVILPFNEEKKVKNYCQRLSEGLKEIETPINIGYPLDPGNRERYQEGIDYKVENIGVGRKRYSILSDKLKEDLRRWNNGHDFENIIEETIGTIPLENSEELERKIREENEKKRQKFIVDNNLPQIKETLFYELNKQEKLFNSQQSPLTESEKAILNDPILKHGCDLDEALS